MKLCKFRCRQCGTEFEAYPGPTDCVNCGFKYVRNMDEYTDIYEVVKEETKEVAEATPSTYPTRNVDDPFVDCNNDSCIG